MKEVKKVFARTLRKDQTKAEKVVWELLRNRKFVRFKFRRQHVIEGFILDFYCPELRLGIEIDGSIHLKQKEYDKIRQKIIESEGIKIIRFTNHEIINGLKMTWKRKILECIGHDATPSPSGRGMGRDKVND